MPAKVICIASPKGGSGKTSLTAAFAAFLSEIGKKVLLIDNDSSTNGLTLLFLKEVLRQNEFTIPEKRKPKGIFEQTNEESLPDITKLKNGTDLIPAYYALKNVEYESAGNYEKRLSFIINKLRYDYDYIFLDAQAGTDVHAQIALKRNISDEVIIISEYDPMSAAGVERLKVLFAEDLTLDRTWVLLNKMLPEFVQLFDDFLEVARYLRPIPWNADVVRAYARRRLAVDFEKGNAYTIAVFRTMQSLLGDEIQPELKAIWDRWELPIITPLDLEINTTESEITESELLLDSLGWKILIESFQAAATATVGIILTGGFIYLLYTYGAFASFARGLFTIVGGLLTLILGIISIFAGNFAMNMLNDVVENRSEKITREKLSLLKKKLDDLQKQRATDLEILLK